MRETSTGISSRPFAPAEPTGDPISLFRSWLQEATQTEPDDPNAMSLATSTSDGHPSLRMVLMKGLDDRGFAFYTNAESQKGTQLQVNPHAAICFHWKSQRRQVRAAGQITQLTVEDAEHYFHSRSRGSQIGAAVSRQSRPLATREEMERAAKALATQYPGSIPLPPYWRGYALRPTTIEFWQDGPDRLHDRVLFTLTGDAWTQTRLYP